MSARLGTASSCWVTFSTELEVELEMVVEMEVEMEVVLSTVYIELLSSSSFCVSL